MPSTSTQPWPPQAGARCKAIGFCVSTTSPWAAGKRARADVADYVLVYRNTKLAVIEPKSWTKPLTEGVGQAKSYATKLAIRHTYATNGQGIYGIDCTRGPRVKWPATPHPTSCGTWPLARACNKPPSGANALQPYRDPNYFLDG